MSIIPVAVVILAAVLGYAAARIRGGMPNSIEIRSGSGPGADVMRELGRRLVVWRDGGSELLTRYDVDEMIDAAYEAAARRSAELRD